MSERQAMSEMELIRALGSTECVCGKWKGERKSHCRKCYFSLPPEQRQALYNRVGDGYEEAYQASVETLGIASERIAEYAASFQK